MPKCRVCGVELTDENWYSSRRKKHEYICMACSKERYRQYYKNHKDKVREWYLKGVYSITISYFTQMLKNQNYSCLICGREFTDDNPACIDHDHKTGEIRALLCRNCNTMIGMANEDPEIFDKAKEYILTYNK